MKYRTLLEGFWKDPELRSLGHYGLVTAQHLLLSSHTNLVGCFRCPPVYTADDTISPTEEVEKALEGLQGVGWLRYCPDSGWVLVANFLKFNPIPNPNVAKAAKSLIEAVPRSIWFYSDFIDCLEICQNRFEEGYLTGLRNRSPNGYPNGSGNGSPNGSDRVPATPTDTPPDTPPKAALPTSSTEIAIDGQHSEKQQNFNGSRNGSPNGMPNQEQEQEQDIRKIPSANADSSSASDDPSATGPPGDPSSKKSQDCQGRRQDTPVALHGRNHDPPAAAFAIWHEIVGDALPLPMKLDPDRRRKLKRRLADSFDDDLERWRKFCARIRGSPHLTGDNERGWVAGLDWCLKPENLRKIQEGNYDDRRRPGARIGAAGSKPTRGVAASHQATVDALRRKRAADG